MSKKLHVSTNREGGGQAISTLSLFSFLAVAVSLLGKLFGRTRRVRRLSPQGHGMFSRPLGELKKWVRVVDFNFSDASRSLSKT